MSKGKKIAIIITIMLGLFATLFGIIAIAYDENNKETATLDKYDIGGKITFSDKVAACNTYKNVYCLSNGTTSASGTYEVIATMRIDDNKATINTKNAGSTVFINSVNRILAAILLEADVDGDGDADQYGHQQGYDQNIQHATDRQKILWYYYTERWYKALKEENLNIANVLPTGGDRLESGHTTDTDEKGNLIRCNRDFAIDKADNVLWPKYKDGYSKSVIIYFIARNGSQGMGLIDMNPPPVETPPKTVPVEKKWIGDNNNKDNTRPTSIQVTLVDGNGNKVTTDKDGRNITNPVTLNASSNNWKHTFTNLDGNKTYKVKETEVTGYTTKVSGNEESGFTITNTLKTIQLTTHKAWNDNNNQDGVRPDSIEVILYANGNEYARKTASSPDYSVTFTNLPEYMNGSKVTYTVKDSAGNKYTLKSDGNSGNSYTITNEHIPEKTKITIIKDWDDDNNRDGLRPTEIKVNIKKGQTVIKTVTLNESNNWTYNDDQLEKYENGKEINYTIEETTILEDYNVSYTNSKNGETIILTAKNTHTPEKIDIPVEKIWDDDSDRDGYQPKVIKITLYANGTEVETATISEASGWKYTFKDLYKCENGKPIKYTIKEENIPEYETPQISPTEISGTMGAGNKQPGKFTITNKHIPEKVDVPVEKKWDDEDDRDGYRPNSIEVTLYANGKKVTTNANGQSIQNPATISSSNDWKYTFKDLYKCENGQPIKYTVTEKAIAEYETPKMEPSEISGTKGANNTTTGTLTVINKHVPERVDIPVEKIWDDELDGELDRDGRRPKSIKVTLYANGEVVTKNAKGETIENPKIIEGQNDVSTWRYTFTDLYKCENGETIKYTIKEETIEYYEDPVPPVIEPTEIRGTKGAANTNPGTFKITNTHIPERIRVEVKKEWNDEDNFDEYRSPIKVTLLDTNKKPVTTDADGNKITNPVTLNEANNWTYTFENLYRYENHGQEINYTVEEEAVNGYNRGENHNEPNAPEYTRGFTDATDAETAIISWNIKNTRVPHYDGYVEITGKVWVDARGGKGNNINGTWGDENDEGLDGIKVTLRDKDGNQFDATSTAVTANGGTYTIKVNYDNSKNVYKLYEDVDTVNEKLKTAYVEFEYDGMTYTTVKTDNSGKSDSTTSKAKEDESSRNTFDNNHSTVTPTTQHPDNWTDKTITAKTQGIISFETYENRTENRQETMKYCNGNGSYIRTNPDGAWNEILPGTLDLACNNGSGHEIAKHDVEVTKIENVNLGLFEREQPDVAVFIDLTKVKVEMNGQRYTYLYGVRSNENNNVGLQTKFQTKGTYTYRRPVNPADIAYIQEPANSNAMSVEVIYEVKVANLSTTLPITVHQIKDYYDSRYTLNTAGWTTSGGSGFTQAISGDLNMTVEPQHESEAIELSYTVSLDAIQKLLNEEATLNNAVEIESFGVAYGENTLYAEQQTGGRTGKPYAGYDYNSHPGNANIQLKTGDDGVERLYSTDVNGNIIPLKDMEDDTDIAPSFVLCLDEPKTLSGNVWEDKDINEDDEFRLGNGKKESGENNLANAKVELLKVKDTGELETAYLYKKGTTEKKEAITKSDSNGNYSFGSNADEDKWSVVTDRYVIRFTYGEGIDDTTTSTINDVNVNARNYKSTIISNDAKALYDVFKGTSTDENWHLNIGNNYSIAVDDIDERIKIEDLQYSNFDKAINMPAYSKPFKMQVEFNSSGSSEVGEDGKTTFGNDLNVFNFGIIERAREDIYVDKTVSYLTVTLANGQVLTEGDPRSSQLNYVKAVGLNLDSRSAADKQILIEMDSELLQGAQIEVQYEVKVVNNSEIDYDYYVNDETIKTEYYYFGTNTEGAPVITSSVNKLVDYVSADIADGYTWENPDAWTKVTADELSKSGEKLVCDHASEKLQSGEYVAYITNQFNELRPGDSASAHATAKKLLANQADNSLDNHIEILQIDAKTARTIKATGVPKECKPGDYVPSLEPRVVNDENFEEEPGKHEQDDDRINVMVTNATGVTNYITTYVITGAIGLMVIALGVVFIKKKVLKK